VTGAAPTPGPAALPGGRRLGQLADLPVTVLRGVGDAAAGDLAELGITSVLDLVTHYPRRYIDGTRMVTVDRLTDGKALPHDMIMEGLRPVLRENQPRERTPTPLRLLCRPFEDFLFNGARKEKQKGRVARASVVPVWNWLLTLIPDECNSYRENIKKLVLAYKMEEALECASKFWPVAGEAMRSAIAKDRARARVALNGDLALGDAEDISVILCAGTAMVEIQQLLPKPVPALTDDLLWSLRQIYDRVIETAVDSAPYVPVAAMCRLAKPWEALKLALLITHQTQDTLISSTDMGLVGDILFSRMEDSRMAIHATRHPNFDVVVLLENLKFFTDISSAIVKEVEIIRKEVEDGPRREHLHDVINHAECSHGETKANRAKPVELGPIEFGSRVTPIH